MKKVIRFLNRPISRQAFLVFAIGSLVVLFQLGYITWDILYGNHTHMLYTLALYRKCLSQILLEVVILLVGSFLFDITVRECTGIQ